MTAKEAEAHGVTAEVTERLHANITDVDDTVSYMHCLLYGRLKIGKTVLAAKFAQAIGTKMLLISSDNGSVSITNHPELRPHVKVIKYNNPNRLVALAKAIRYQAPGFEQYGVVSIDTLSGIADEYIDHLENNYNATGKQGGRDKLTPKSGLNLPLIELASGEDFKALRSYIRPIVSDFCKAPVHTFWITHEREPYFMEVVEAKKRNEKVPIRPDLTDKTYKAIGYYIQLLTRMTRARNGQRYVTCEYDPDYETGSRIKELENRKVTDDEFIRIAATWAQKHAPKL